MDISWMILGGFLFVLLSTAQLNDDSGGFFENKSGPEGLNVRPFL